MTRIHIGTSGWHYKHWRGPFYPEKLPASKMLEFYTRHFDTVELNNTFYRLPLESGLDAWRESTPPGLYAENFLYRRDALERESNPAHRP